MTWDDSGPSTGGGRRAVRAAAIVLQLVVLAGCSAVIAWVVVGLAGSGTGLEDSNRNLVSAAIVVGVIGILFVVGLAGLLAWWRGGGIALSAFDVVVLAIAIWVVVAYPPAFPWNLVVAGYAALTAVALVATLAADAAAR